MRITFVLAAFDLAGGERVAAIYASELMKRGHEVFAIACPPPPVGWRRRLRALIRGETLPIGKYEASHFALSDVPHATTDRFRPIRDDDVPDGDILVATWWETAHWVSAMSPVKGVKVHFVQGNEMLVSHNAVERVEAAWRLPIPKITISKYITRIVREFGSKDTTEVPNSVDTHLFHAPPRGKNVTPTVGFLHHRMPLKGVAAALEALCKVREVLPNLRVVAFGAEPPSPDLPLPDYVTYHRLPAQDAIRDIYAQCDVWLCASKAEGFHLPPLEAMACRCPVVSTRVGGPEDVIENGVNGYLCEQGDEETLVARLLSVLSLSDAEWQNMSDAALATATRYTWQDATDRFEAALAHAVENGAAVSNISSGPSKP